MYVKLFASILDSSIWAESEATRLVWITMLAMADEKGHVRASPSGLARRANVSLVGCREALGVLEAPDIESASQEWGGRRIEPVEGGWTLLNYEKYREIRTEEQLKSAARQRRHYHKQRRETSREGEETSRTSRTDTEADTEAEVKPSVTNVTGDADSVTHRDLMGAIREHLYVDSKAPKDWDPKRDGSIVNAILKHGVSRQDVLDAIRGVSLMREAGEISWCGPGEALTMKALYTAKHGPTDLFTAGQTAYYRAQNSGAKGDQDPVRKKPYGEKVHDAVHVGDVLKRFV